MMNKGFSLFISVVTTGTLLMIGTGLVTLAYKQSIIASSYSASQLAFYAADTGVECTLYWDVQNPAGSSAFSTTTGSTIYCNKDISNPSNEWVVGGTSTSTFAITFLPEEYCAVVTINKRYVSTNLVTTIESKGYNTCNASDQRRVERAIRATY